MMFAGRKTPAACGELTAWDDNEDAFNWLMTQYGAQPGEGLLILEIQERLYEFLVQCCKAVLHDIPEETLADPNTPVQDEPPPVTSNEAGLASLAISAAETPDRLPANLDLKRPESVIYAKLEAAEDHIWLLREDPGYSAEHILDWKEHLVEMLRDDHGRRHPTLVNSTKEHILWEDVISNLLFDAFFRVEVWESLRKQMNNLQTLQRKQEATLRMDQSPPPECALAFHKLHHHLIRLSKEPISRIETGFAASPPVRQYWVRIQQGSKEILDCRSPPKDKSFYALSWLIQALCDERQLHLARLLYLMDELARTMEQDTGGKRAGYSLGCQSDIGTCSLRSLHAPSRPVSAMGCNVRIRDGRQEG